MIRASVAKFLRSLIWGLPALRRAPKTPVGESVDFRVLLESTVDLVCMVQLTGEHFEHTYVSPSTPEILGWSCQEFLSLHPPDLYPEASLQIIALNIASIRAGQNTSMVVLEAIRKDGAHIFLENKIRVLSRAGNDRITIVITMRDVTERKLLQDLLARQALTDSLTGLANRRAFDEVLRREWEESERTCQPLSLILLDVDRFKLLNDTYGHQVGDDCLRAIASAVRSAAHRPRDFVARYGGEEMAVILPCTDMAGAAEIAASLCALISGLRIPIEARAKACGIVTASCGVATVLARPGSNFRMPEGLFQSADAALYRAKYEGRNRVVSSILLTSPQPAVQV